MKRKIVAIGGGGNGSKIPYELANQDKEIIRLTGKKHPNFLLIAHSQPLEKQEEYFKIMLNIYEKKYNCICKDLKSNELDNQEYVRKLVDWADIIYECGGNTLDMIKIWKETGFDNILRTAWENGKVMCGVSAGANCWFKGCSTDSLRIKYGSNQPLVGMDCLGFINCLFIPHCDEAGRLESAEEILKDSELVGISISNCAALEIIDDKYRLIVSDASYHGIEAYGLKSYWENEKYVTVKIDNSQEFKLLSDLISKSENI